jgi:hypothetical protein
MAQRRTLLSHPVRLGDVVGGVTEQDDAGPRLARGVGDEGVAGATGGGRQAGRGFLALPDTQNPVRADTTSLDLAEAVPRTAVGVQAVVDGDRQQTPPRAPGPVRRDVKQSQRISAPRQRNRDRRRDRPL